MKPLQRKVNGILLLDKPKGDSSNRALQKIKRLFNAKKAGHTGTLDPLASGLLPVCFGEATKVAQYLLDSDKRYLSEFIFGSSTTTGDVEGEISENKSWSNIDEADVVRRMFDMTGELRQIPPMYSAIKSGGKRLYDLARKGLTIEREARKINIRKFDLLSYQAPICSIDVTCSKGTYIRVLAEDLAVALGTVGHVASLRRTQSGAFHVKDAYTINALELLAEKNGVEFLDSVLLPLDHALTHLNKITLLPEISRMFVNGLTLATPSDFLEGELLRVYSKSKFLGIGEVDENGQIVPKRGFNV
ncbi:MAG: tRNA pseudouridine(55) synthase TruB [Gammaproteobacteria bacterium]